MVLLIVHHIDASFFSMLFIFTELVSHIKKMFLEKKQVFHQFLLTVFIEKL